MKYLFLLTVLLLSFTCRAQVKLVPLPSLYKVKEDTISYMEWFNLYQKVNEDITFIMFKGHKVETLVHHYKRKIKYVTFSLYNKRDYKGRVIVTQSIYKIPKGFLVKT